MQLTDESRLQRHRRRVRLSRSALPRATVKDRPPAPLARHAADPRWVLLPMVAGFVGIASRQPGLVLAGATLVLALVASLLWGRWALRRLECRRLLETDTAHFGDDVALRIEVTNRKILPLAWLEYTDGFPPLLDLVRGRPMQGARRFELRTLLTLRPYERVTRRYTVRCLARGEHAFGPIVLRAGDLFGLTVRTVTLDQPSYLLVYPRLVGIESLGLPATYPLGEQRALQSLHRNPLDIAGVRPYLPGDTLRQVHWRATARAGSVQVKVHEPSTSLRALIILNAETTIEARAGIRPGLLEAAITAAASIAAHLTLGRWEVGLVANAQGRGLAGRLRVPPSASVGQIDAILSALARVDAGGTIAFPDVAEFERLGLRIGTTVIVVTAVLTGRLIESVRGFAIDGHAVSLLLLGADLRTVTDQETGVPTRWLGEEQHWIANEGYASSTAPGRPGIYEGPSLC